MRKNLNWAVTLIAIAFFAACTAVAQSPKTHNVVVIVTDGLRWQEVFRGADPALITREHGGVPNLASVQKQFGRENALEAREVLMPFLWTEVARKGQIFGNVDKGSPVRVTNPFKFSYPGYSEMLTGYPDPRVDRNDLGPNPNVTVFEWLNGKPAFKGKVAAFGTWDAFDGIFNRERAKILVHSGWEVPAAGKQTPRLELLRELYRTTTRVWDGPFDSFMHAVVEEYVRSERPRVLFVGCAETDGWAHNGRYDRYLSSANRVDQFIARLWNLMQSMPEYRGKTTFLITTDHGRGNGLKDWRNHGQKVEGAEQTWMAVLGPDTRALGERAQIAGVTTAQVAATVAALVGEDYHAAVPQAASPIADVVMGGSR